MSRGEAHTVPSREASRSPEMQALRDELDAVYKRLALVELRTKQLGPWISMELARKYLGLSRSKMQALVDEGLYHCPPLLGRYLDGGAPWLADSGKHALYNYHEIMALPSRLAAQKGQPLKQSRKRGRRRMACTSP